MSYFGVDRLVQHSKTINVNVSQSSQKKVLINSFKTINVKGVFFTSYSSNFASKKQSFDKTINVKNTLTSPASGDVNLAFSTMYVKSNTTPSYGQKTKLTDAKKAVHVVYKNTNNYSSQLVTTLSNTSVTMIVDTNNSDQVLVLSKDKDFLLPTVYETPPTVSENLVFSESDIWA
jgi:hypothetical protein